jgi:DNA-binding NarL/FixJ family response regulator
MIRIVLADDEALIRAGVKSILATDADIEVVAEAADGREAIELARVHRPDILMLDIRMPRLDGLAAAAELRVTMPEVAVIMLTTFDEDGYVSRALDEGASGFLLKAADPRELIIGVRAVADGAAYLSPRIARKVITQLGGGKISRAGTARRQVESLTRREREVLALVGRGLANQDIGRELFL